MGAGQSTSAPNGARAQTAQVKTSYYELLGVDKSASEDEIKKAYRRKALELHPDRNFGNAERTTTLFAEIQVAHEVLSDPQERAWYDSHEDAILHDIDPTISGEGGKTYEQNMGLTSADDITRMFRKFNSKIEFSDAPSGFFGFLRDTFEQLASEEEGAAFGEGGTVPEYPRFGHKDDDHSTAKTFYGVWNAFSTRKSFAWRDRHRVTDAEDRWMRRQMEKENKQFRAQGKQEFNEAVRSLVAFVKKRDPRYVPNTLSEAERQNVLREAARAQASRMRAANAAHLNDEVPEWTKSREPDDAEEETEEESEEERHECVACRKTFKSENQFDAHERSKKHQKAVRTLRKKLKKEGLDLDLGDDMAGASNAHLRHEGTIGDNLARATDTELNDDETGCASLRTNIDDTPLHCISPAEGGGPPYPQATSQNCHLYEEELDNHENYKDDDDDDDDDDDNDDDDNDDDDDVCGDGGGGGDDRSASPPFNSANTPTEVFTKKLGKAAQKRAKRAAQQEMQKTGANSAITCASCGNKFPSKSKLFQHIKAERHAAVKQASGVGWKKNEEP